MMSGLLRSRVDVDDRRARMALRLAMVRGRIPVGSRVYAIGDVHGRADLLSAKFRTIDAHLAAHPIARPITVLLGDYIDRGPQPRAVLDLILARCQTSALVALAGNHEMLFLRFLDEPSSYPDWVRLGGIDTLLSYGLLPPRAQDPAALGALAAKTRAAVTDAHVAWLRTLHLCFAWGDFFFVHAGVRPNVSLGAQAPLDLMWIRDEFLDHVGDFGAVVVHGHTRVEQPDIRANRINIDTGAYASNRLTCLVIDDGRCSLL